MPAQLMLWRFDLEFKHLAERVQFGANLLDLRSLSVGHFLGARLLLALEM